MMFNRYLVTYLLTKMYPFRPWKKEEEAEETPPNPGSHQIEARCISSSVPGYHRFCSLQGLPPRKDRFHR